MSEGLPTGLTGHPEPVTGATRRFTLYCLQEYCLQE